MERATSGLKCTYAFARMVALSVMALASLCGCRQAPPRQLPPRVITGDIVATWHASTTINGKRYKWIYTFWSDGTFYDQDINEANELVGGGVGKYTLQNDSVTIDWSAPKAREKATIVWKNPDEFQYKVTAHSDEQQVGLETTFHRGEAAKPVQPKADPPSDNILSRMPASRLEKIVMAFSETRGFREIGNDNYVFEVNGLKIVLFNRAETMVLTAVFSGTTTQSRINDWNRNYRFTRAYLDSDENPVLQSDFDLTGGVTEENAREWIRTFVTSLGKFKSHLEE